jgi:hypothetical protein
LGQDTFAPESQIIALADTFNAIVRFRPDGKGLSVSEALRIIEKDTHKFHGGLKDIFLTIVKRVEQNLAKGKYLPKQAEEYSRACLCLEEPDKKKNKENDRWPELQKFLDEIKYNYLGIISVIDWEDGISLLDENIKINDKPVQLTKIKDKHILLSIRDIPKEEGFIWLNKILNYLKSLSIKGKVAFAFIGKRGHEADIQKIYESLQENLKEIKNEPVHYYLNPEMYKCG